MHESLLWDFPTQGRITTGLPTYAPLAITFPFHKTVAITPRGTSDHKSALAGATITQTRDNTRSI